MKLPWKEKRDLNLKKLRKLRKEEQYKLLQIIRERKPNDEEYADAIGQLKQLHEMEIADRKVDTYFWSKVTEVLGGIGVMVGIASIEAWAPIPGQAFRNFRGFVKGTNDNNLLS